MGASMMRMRDGRAAACGPPVVIASRGLWKAAREACPRSCTSSCARILLLTEATRHPLSKVVPPLVVLALGPGRLVDAARRPSDRPRSAIVTAGVTPSTPLAREEPPRSKLPHVCGRRSGNHARQITGSADRLTKDMGG